MERWLGKELPDHGVNLRYLGEDIVTLKGEVVWVVKVLGIGGHLSDSLWVTSLDQGFGV